MMKYNLPLMILPLLPLAATPCEAQEHSFDGPRVGVEVAYEDYGANVDGETISAVAGWDLAVGEKAVIGLEARYNLHDVESSQTSRTPAGFLQTADVAIDENWGIAARVGVVVTDNLLLFGQGGYERLDIAAFRTVRADACVPPNGCVVSRTDFSLEDDMWTIGAGIEWAATKNLRVRGQYTYGESDSYDRNRISLGIGWQF